MSDGLIRPATREDSATIDALLLAAFESGDETRLARTIRENGEDAVSLVHVTGGAIDGYCLASPMQSPQGCLGIGPFAVDADRRGSGTGQALIEAVIEAATAGGWQAVFVLGDPAFYGRFGFSMEKAARFETAYPKEYFMVLELVPGVAETLPVKVVYADGFDLLDI